MRACPSAKPLAGKRKFACACVTTSNISRVTAQEGVTPHAHWLRAVLGSPSTAMVDARPCSLLQPPADAPSGLRADGCLLGCRQRRSVVVFDLPGKAGLLDRAHIFAALGNLAASLCAVVVGPSPCTVLAAKHNVDHLPLNCSARHWTSRYLNFSFDDGSTVIRSSAWHQRWLRQVGSDTLRIGAPVPRAAGGGMHVASNSSQHAQQEHAAAVAAAARGTAFEWRLRENPLVWSPWRDVRPTSRGSGSFRRRKAAAAASLADATPPDAPEEAPCPRPLPRPPAILVGGSQRKPSATCTYVRQHAAAGATFLADLFMRNLDARDGAFNVLHLRRNDKADPRVCNTSVARAVQVCEQALEYLGDVRLPIIVWLTAIANGCF